MGAFSRTLSALLLLSCILPACVSANEGGQHPLLFQAGDEHGVIQTPSTGVDSLDVPASKAPCFPSAEFTMPSTVPNTTANWWCPMNNEYAFMGFSYSLYNCQSLSQMQREFKDMKTKFKARYVRLYAVCDRKGFYDDVITAAWDNGLGVHALIWFGFDNTPEWKDRRATLFNTLHTHPKARFVTRALQFGSEPLYDWVLTPDELAAEVVKARKNLTSIGIPVTISEMAWGYQLHGGSKSVLEAVDFFDIHMLPYFSQQASTSDKAWPILMKDHNWFVTNGLGKKMFWSQNGWPSKSYPGVEPNSPDAVADIPNEAGYYKLLDEHCTDFKAMANGGVGWFWHVYSDSQLQGYGLYDTSGQLKFPFQPKIAC
ncbi:glycoside hydrolase superfamily [Pterulicium gracile]|uniref:glucan endo-1,3-beta-D-glucosidase n=1 Tax=Pterulicium gracile TaxID=1884261 RepID=A0A5C3QIQ5_9AGAR|nr:glycoside hydrolase superfamily [Pterula gracilis]